MPPTPRAFFESIRRDWDWFRFLMVFSGSPSSIEADAWLSLLLLSPVPAPAAPATLAAAAFAAFTLKTKPMLVNFASFSPDILDFSPSRNFLYSFLCSCTQVPSFGKLWGTMVVPCSALYSMSSCSLSSHVLIPSRLHVFFGSASGSGHLNPQS